MRMVTRSGFELGFSLKRSDCEPFGFYPFQKVATPRGLSTVVGYADGKLWFFVDGDCGAWYFTKQEFDNRSSEFYLLDDSYTVTKFLKKNKHSLLPLKPSECEWALKCIPGIDEFKNLSSNKVWTAELDGMLVSTIGFYCEKNEINPWNISADILQRDIFPTISAVCPSLSIEACIARLCCLRIFNEQLIPTLPYMQTCIGIEQRQSNGSANNTSSVPKVSIKESGSFAFSLKPQDELVTLGHLLIGRRGSIFLHVKSKLLNVMLERTATRAKKAEDDYDYPEDLPQLLLNRPKAAMARDHNDIETRISYSLFGQAFDELHFMDPTTLRMAYTHPMDDGQQRTFKVKFEGEGVDDYGGPYRECFSQFVEELQAVTTNDNESGSESCILPLLAPAPNRLNGSGNNRERFVINPSFLSPKRGSAVLYLEMFNFFGQLLGMALRNRISLHLELASTIWKPLLGEVLNISDLVNIDTQAANVLQSIKDLAKTVDEEPLQMEIAKDILADITWTTHLSDGTKVVLRRDSSGAEKAVELTEITEYCESVINARLLESSRAAIAMRDGLTTIIPCSILPLFTWKEFESRVCGQPDVNVDLLMECTEYDDDVSPTDAHIVMFWEVLRSLTPAQRRQFLRFVWARARLPPTASEFKQ